MREQRGWSRADLERETNYSESLIAMMETYQRAPTLALAKALDRAFQVLPYSAGGHSGLEGAFMIADFPAAQSILFRDEISGGQVVEEAAIVAAAALHFTALRSDALPRVASLDLLMKVAEERWTV